MKKKLYLKSVIVFSLLMLVDITSHAQVTTNGGSGLATTYANLNAAITALNAATITSPVVINLSASNPQTAPIGGYEIKAEGSSVNTITFNGNGNTITASATQVAGNLYDGIFKIIGGDYITLDGFILKENNANTITVAATNNMTEFGIALFYATTTNGANSDTIKNCTIDLDRTYQNTFGIYSNTNHSATAPAVIAAATAIAGNNNGLVILNNTVTDVNMGIICIGSSIAGMECNGVTIGGDDSSEGNTITNFGTNSITSSYVGIAASIDGVLIRYTTNYNVSNNIITSSNGGLVTGIGTLNGVYVQPSATMPLGVINNKINANTIDLISGVPVTQIFGVRVEALTANPNTTLTIDENNFIDLNHSVPGASGTITGIINASMAFTRSISNNTFLDIDAITSGSFTFINDNVLIPDGGSQTISGNAIVSEFTKLGEGGFVTLFTSSAASTNNCTVIHSDNNFSNITVFGNTTILGWLSTDGASSTNGPTKTISNNTFTNWATVTGSVTALTLDGSSANSNVFNNTIADINSGNNFNGIYIKGNDNAKVYNNNINSVTSTSGDFVNGIVFSGTGSSNTPSVYKNKIYNLLANSSTGVVTGMLVDFASPVTPLVSSSVISIYNNLIGDLKTPNANNTASDAVRGIAITSYSSSTVKVYFNTININAASTGTNFSTAGIFHIQCDTTDYANLDLRNNIIINRSTANGSGITAAFKRSRNGLGNYASTSNNNVFYAGTPSSKNVIFYNGIAYQTLADFKTLVATRESASKTENVAFLSTLGTSSNFLHINSLIPTVCESSATAIAGILDDYDGNIRSSLPDIGADEFIGVVVPITLSSFTGTKQASGNLLSWTTATEINNTGFELQRSADGVNFSTLTFVASKANNGNSNAVLNYSFVDTKSLFATGYYRLKQIDKDGKYSISSIVMIKSGKVAGIELTGVYPNPAISNLNVMVSSAKADNISFVVSDLSGRIVLRQQASVVDGENTIKLNVSALAKGTYSIQAVCANGCETAVSKFIKQ